MQTTIEVNPQPWIAPCINMWSVTFLCHLLNVGAYICHISQEGQVESHHTIKMLHFVSLYSFTCYTNPIVSRIYVNTTKLHNITCTLVAIGVILRSLECMSMPMLISPLTHHHVPMKHFKNPWGAPSITHLSIHECTKGVILNFAISCIHICYTNYIS